MLSKRNRVRIKYYFIGPSRRYRGIFWIGASVLLVAFLIAALPELRRSVFEFVRQGTSGAVDPSLVLLGVGAIGATTSLYAILARIGIYFRTPSHRKIDRWYALDRDALFERGLQKSGITEADLIGEKQVLIYGQPALDLDVNQYYRVGRDQVVRFSHTEVSTLYFTEDELLIYECVLDHLTGKPLNEATHEFFYRFVAGVSIMTQSGQVQLHGKDEPIQWNDVKSFSLAISGTDAICVTLGDLEPIKELGGKIPPSDVDKAIASVRKMIRDKNATS